MDLMATPITNCYVTGKGFEAVLLKGKSMDFKKLYRGHVYYDLNTAPDYKLNFYIEEFWWDETLIAKLNLLDRNVMLHAYDAAWGGWEVGTAGYGDYHNGDIARPWVKACTPAYGLGQGTNLQKVWICILCKTQLQVKNP